MIAVFFVVLARSMRRAELQPWVNAWLANVGALAVTTIYWLFQPESELAFAAIRFCYFFGKTMFVALLAVGAGASSGRGLASVTSARWCSG